MNVFGFSLIEAVNFAVLFSFIFGGVTMFWFIQKLYGKYWVSVVAGGLFTFSSYHFAHALGHLQLVSLEFIPLFLLAFWTLLEKLRYHFAVLAAGSLFLVLLCDYYYFFWSVMVGGMWFLWKLYKKELKLDKPTIKVLSVFAVLSGALAGPLVVGLLRLNKHDPLTGFHDPTQFALDPLTVIIPGGSWYWSTLTDWHWLQLPYTAEMSVFFGYALLAVVLTVFYKTFFAKGKKKLKTPSWLNFWWIVLFVFGIFSLGPRPTTFGKTLHDLPLPYALFEKIFPTLKISGMPVRWILIVLIAAIVIASFWLSKLNLKVKKHQILFGAFILVSFIDLWPFRLPLTSPIVHSQAYVSHLKDLPYGAVLDNGARTDSEQLFHQTIHHKPIAFGYVSRLPKSVEEKDFHIFAALEEGRYDQLCSVYRLRYITMPVERPIPTTFPAIYNDGQTLIYDFKNSTNC